MQRPPKGQEMVKLQEEIQSGPRLHRKLHFLLVYANNNHKKEYKEKVLSLTQIDFKNSTPRRSFSKVAKSSQTSILSIIKPYFDPQITYLLFI